MAQTVEQVLREGKLVSDNQVYAVLSLPPAAITAAAGVIAELSEPFSSLIVDKDEVTLVMPADAVADFARRIPGYQMSETHYRLITLDLPLEPTLVGLMARISGGLAEAKIPIFPFAAFSRDHLLVPADQFDAALAALEKLRS